MSEPYELKLTDRELAILLAALRTAASAAPHYSDELDKLHATLMAQVGVQS